MALSRKHYEAMAEIVGQHWPNSQPVAEQMADYFARDNSRFSRDVFLTRVREVAARVQTERKGS